MTAESHHDGEDKKAKKKQKKLRRAQERAWLEARLAQSVTRPRAEQAALHEWGQALASDRVVAATKASLLVALNGVMLAVAAHALYQAPAFGPMVPLALTNLLSLGFSVAAARQVREGDFSAPPRPLEQPRDELYARLERELSGRSGALVRCRSRLRSAYAVLLGGVGLVALTFVAWAV